MISEPNMIFGSNNFEFQIFFFPPYEVGLSLQKGHLDLYKKEAHFPSNDYYFLFILL